MDGANNYLEEMYKTELETPGLRDAGEEGSIFENMLERISTDRVSIGI